jgi:hypothetical protein
VIFSKVKQAEYTKLFHYIILIKAFRVKAKTGNLNYKKSNHRYGEFEALRI